MRVSARPILIGVILALLVGLAGYIAAERWIALRTVSQVRGAAIQMARGNAGLLDSELQKFRLLPTVLAEYSDVQTLLADGSPQASAQLNRKLELLADKTNAADIYLLNSQGVTVAASNWRLKSSFVGQDYSFRPYFSNAKRFGESEMFALGTVSHRPGLFFSHRVDRVAADGSVRSIGVVVVKVEFGPLESNWTHQPGATLVTDLSGIVVITSKPDWRFRATRSLSPEMVRHLRATRQFGDHPLAPVPLSSDGYAFTKVADNGDRFVEGTASILIGGWRLIYLSPLDSALLAGRGEARAIAVSLTLLALFLVLLVVIRRERQVLQIETRRALENEVELRTAELRETNARLQVESAERHQADRRFRLAREELAQANRLGSLGQITASVAHEINQPVAAIRTFAENAILMLRRERVAGAHENLDRIVALADRIGRITAEMRAFARRGTPPAAAVSLKRVVEGTMLLIGDALNAAGVELDVADVAQDVTEVAADRIRLEQVMINLLQNAIEATAGIAEARVKLSARLEKEWVLLTLEDNGPGIPPELAQTLFNPFITGKHEGLGLGLGIARDIVREFGGELSLVSSSLGGAAFQLRLKRV